MSGEKNEATETTFKAPTETSVDTSAGASMPGEWQRLLRRNALYVVAVVFLLVGAFGWLASLDSEEEAPSADNHALTDKAATSEVSTEVSRALTGVLSYDYADPSVSQKIVDNVLTGDARKEYDVLLKNLQEKAPGQKLVLTAQVQAAAVKELNDDRATLLVFLDQTSKRVDDKEASISAAQLSIEARKVDGAWTITQLRPL
ncbi:hypothetical protein [Nocardioides sp. Root140]|uniref:hypothetical protein n=1 Tax=Nocardioides sp. Root140 TaxID=1736460 RepID=UPI0006F75FB5|nr:hypothetical protein [Nocardioides sp. Root140]KQY56667.1 hypothetical protein ASD30_10140 [Nocardioides sp. Root140]